MCLPSSTSTTFSDGDVNSLWVSCYLLFHHFSIQELNSFPPVLALCYTQTGLEGLFGVKHIKSLKTLYTLQRPTGLGICTIFSRFVSISKLDGFYLLKIDGTVEIFLSTVTFCKLTRNLKHFSDVDIRGIVNGPETCYFSSWLLFSHS